MNKALIFNTDTGIPVKLDAESNDPTFYLRPNDTDFIERLTKLYEATKDYDIKAKVKREALEIKVDENNIPENIGQYIEMMKDDFDFIMVQIDDLLGAGVSKAVFKDRRDEDLLMRFMDFIAEQITENRKSTVNKYAKSKTKGVMR